MLVWLASPVDLIPDFIPVVGYLDDVIVIVLLLDYVLNEVPMEVIAEHFPGDVRSVERMRKRTRFIHACVPGWIRRRLWATIDEVREPSGVHQP